LKTSGYSENRQLSKGNLQFGAYIEQHMKTGRQAPLFPTNAPCISVANDRTSAKMPERVKQR
jgi:hypothetical protein